MKIVNTQRPITPKVGKPELPFMHSACCLSMFNICVNVFMKVCQAVLKLRSRHEKTVNTQRAITPKVVTHPCRAVQLMKMCDFS